jgi:hypothetical protein
VVHKLRPGKHQPEEGDRMELADVEDRPLPDKCRPCRERTRKPLGAPAVLAADVVVARPRDRWA